MKLFLIFVIFVWGCKFQNEKITPEAEQETLLDSAYFKIRDVYYWNKKLPSSEIFKPKLKNSLNGLLESIRGYSENGIDKWSFAISKEKWTSIVENKNTGFGLSLTYWSDTDLRCSLVFNESDAYKKNIRRGTKILSINQIIGIVENKSKILEALKGSELKIKFIDENIKTQETTIYRSAFVKNTIINPKIINNNIGYFTFDIFEGKNTKKELSEIIENFKERNINELIIDLRYNHGGDGSIALFLANLIAPKDARGKVFSRIINNEKYSSLNYSLFFSPETNNLDLKRVFFITSPETASSSEVLINSLKAVMEVKIIGERTHGKPFGFFTIPLGDYYLLPVAFKNVNSDGYGDYIDGLQVDVEAEDDITHDFGDINESSLKTVLSFITTKNTTIKNNKKRLEYLRIESQSTQDLFYFSPK
jgi:carboxyl-terminal processing protease